MKKCLLTCLAVYFIHSLVFAQKPINDECSGAIEITPASSYSPIVFNLKGATASDTAHPNELDVWYKFVATAPSVKVITKQGSYDWKSIAYLYDTCGGKRLAEGTQSISSLRTDNLVVGGTYYYRYNAFRTSSSPTDTDTVTFGVVNISVTEPNDLPPGRTPLQIGTQLTYTASNYLKGRHNVFYSHYNCNTSQADTNVIDLFFQFTASETNANFDLKLDDATWAATMEIIDSTVAGFESSDASYKRPCMVASNNNLPNRSFSALKLVKGQTYVLRLEIGGTNSSPVGHFPKSSSSLGFSIVMRTPDPAAIEEQSKAAVTVFPNPSNGTFTITQNSGTVQMQLMDVLGRIVYAKAVQHEQENLNVSLAPGIYFLKLYKEEYQQILRIEIK